MAVNVNVLYLSSYHYYCSKATVWIWNDQNMHLKCTFKRVYIKPLYHFYVNIILEVYGSYKSFKSVTLPWKLSANESLLE